MASLTKIGICFWACWSLATVLEAQALSATQKLEIVYKMYGDYKRDFPEVQDISPQDAMVLLKNKQVVFVDSRMPEEQRVSMLPGAVTQDVFLENPENFKDRTVVAYCTISYRSGGFANEMLRKGLTVFNLKGGILAWVLEGGKVFDRHGETKRIHVYGDQWDYAPPDYETVRFSWWDRIFFKNMK